MLCSTISNDGVSSWAELYGLTSDVLLGLLKSIETGIFCELRLVGGGENVGILFGERFSNCSEAPHHVLVYLNNYVNDAGEAYSVSSL